MTRLLCCITECWQGCGNYSELYGNCEAFMDLIAACEAEKEAVQ